MDALVAIVGMIAVCLTAGAFLLCLMILPQLAEKGNKMRAVLVWIVVIAVTSWLLWATLNFFNRQIVLFHDLTGRNPTIVEFFKYGASESGLDILKKKVAKGEAGFSIEEQKQLARTEMIRKEKEQRAAALRKKKSGDPSKPSGPRVKWRKEDLEEQK